MIASLRLKSILIHIMKENYSVELKKQQHFFRAISFEFESESKIIEFKFLYELFNSVYLLENGLAI